MPPTQTPSSTGPGNVPQDKHSGKVKTAHTAPLLLKIDDKWFDLSRWGQHHPGGAEILQHLKGQDATDVFYSLHSKEAIERLNKFRPADVPSDKDVTSTKLDINFRKFRKELENEGYFERNPLWEAFYPLSVIFLIMVGVWCAPSHPVIATFLVGVALEQAGWIGHDYVHGRGAGCWWGGRILGGIVNGFSSEWWSNKHNTHHAYPNHFGIDSDVHNDPVLHLWYPDAEKDHPFRRLQHFYYIAVVGFLFVSWRIQSFFYAWERKNVPELFCIALSNIWLFGLLPWKVALGSVYLGGWLVGIIVTATHQSEELIDPSEDRQYDFVRDQFISTRDATSSNPVMNWLWGGMQYQLEHHLFPTMPKYYYPAIIDRLRKFAKDNNIEYLSDDVWTIWYRNFCTMKKYAQDPADDSLRKKVQ